MLNQPTTPEECQALLREVLGENYEPPAHQDCTLTFPLDQVRAAAEHAIAATDHAPGPGETDARPRLWWIKGDGTFLMSNGIDRPNTRDSNGHRQHIVFAESWGPGTDPSTILGGDDLHETLDLTHPDTDTHTGTDGDGEGPALIELLRDAPDHATRFLLHITHDDDGMALTMTTE